MNSTVLALAPPLPNSYHIMIIQTHHFVLNNEKQTAEELQKPYETNWQFFLTTL